MCSNCTELHENILKFKNENIKCYTLSSYILKVLQRLKGSNYYLDLYVEDMYQRFLHKILIPITLSLNDGRLQELYKFYSKPHDNLRYHYVDTRMSTVSEYIDSIPFDTRSDIRIFKNKVKYFYDKSIHITKILIRTYTTLCATSINFEEDYTNFIKGWSKKIKKKDKINNLIFKNIKITKLKFYKNMILHPIGKQFIKLLEQEKYSNDYTKRIEEMINYIFKITDDYNLSWQDINKSNREQFLRILNSDGLTRMKAIQLYEEFLDKIYSTEMLNMTIFMDVYAIPRILYNYEHSILKIVSVGEFHKHIYSKFFDHFYPNTMCTEIMMVNNNRCLNL